MFRIDSPGSVNGRFHDGSPATGQEATQLTADWFNALQDEIVAVIEGANIALNEAQSDQMYQAIVALIAGVVGDGSGAVPTTRQVLSGGLVTGGGNLSADRTLTVPKASAAEVAAGTNDTKAITPLALMGGQGSRLLQGTGYATLFSILFQWGTCTANANSSTNVILPVAFPNQCVHADFSGGRIETDAQDNDPVVTGKSATAITLWSSRDEFIGGTFFAIGF